MNGWVWNKVCFRSGSNRGEWIIDELDFLEGTEETATGTWLREFVRANLGYPVVRPKKSLLEATRALFTGCKLVL